VLTNPVYAGVYDYGKSCFENTLDASGLRKKRVRKLPVSEWGARIAGNARPRPHANEERPGAARMVFEGSQLINLTVQLDKCGKYAPQSSAP
jgi:hypothetical protein